MTYTATKRMETLTDEIGRVTRYTYVGDDEFPAEPLCTAFEQTYDQRISKTMLNGNSATETPMSATFDAVNRMQTITLNPNKPEQKIYNLTYDNNGNLTKKQLSTDTNCTIDCTDYVWDARNRLTQIKQNQTTSATYSYDAENRRIQTNITNNGQTNQVSYIYAGSQSVGEVRNQQLSHSLMTGLQMDEQIARIALNQGATPQTKTYLTDALGSVIAIAKADQSLEVGYAYSPYGQTSKVGVENQLQGSENNSQYTGRENDQNGLYYYRARYYDPLLKRFISEDPIGLAGGINSHAYVSGNPITFADPSGQVRWSGTYHARALIEGVGAGWVEMVLTSDCIGGRRYKANVTGVGPGIGAGVPKLPPFGSDTYGTFSVSDFLTDIDPSALSGGFGWASIGVSVGKRDASLGRVRVGRAYGNNPDHASGLDIGASAIVGTSTVTSGTWEPCICEPK